MATGHFAPQSLGRLAVCGDQDFEVGVILWQRFCVVGEPEQTEFSSIIPVTDLQRDFGHAPSHRVELHIAREIKNDETRAEQERSRLLRASGLDNRTQPRTYANFEAGEQLALVCEPVLGEGLSSGPVALLSGGMRDETLDSHALIQLASGLSALLVKLHDTRIYGVNFDVDQLREDAGRFFLSSFDHLATRDDQAGSDDDEQIADVQRLLAFLEKMGGSTAGAIVRPEPSSARELLQRVRAMAGIGQLEELELPSEPPFVGREKAMSFLGDGLARARIAQPTAVVIRGNRGVGKSRLLREFLHARVEAKDAFVLAGTWQPRSADTRGGLLGALEQLANSLRNLDPEEREHVRGRINRSIRNLGAIVTRSAPSLGSVLRVIEDLPPLELSGDFNRHTAVMADLLRSIGSQKRPLVLVLDNLETADSRSLAVLKILTQIRPAHHTFVIAGLRDEKRRYTPEFDAEIHDLRPLQIDEINTLLNHTLLGKIDDQDLLAETLLSVSGGYPLAIWANLRTWLDRGLLVHEVGDATWRARKSLQDEIDHEPDVRDLFGFRLAGAATEVRALALRAAVLGLSVSTAELHTLTPSSEEEVEAAVKDLIDRGILTPTSVGVSFPHDSIRELVLESVDATQRREAHRAAAALLRRQDAPLAQIAYHRELGFEQTTATTEEFDRLSFFHVEAGHERLAIYDLERARWHLERALEHSRDPEQRAAAAEALADVYLLSDDFDNAIAMFTALIAGSGAAHAVRAGAKAVQYLFFKSRAEDAQVLGDMALEAVGEPTPTSNFGKFLSLLNSFVRNFWQKPPHSIEVREALCVLYPYMVIKNLATDPLGVMVYIFRSKWLAQDLRSGSAAVALSFEASMRATIGHFSAADKLFSKLSAIAVESNDAWARGISCHTQAHTLCLPSNRYEEGQDLLDDAIAAFRETGDMSVAVISLMMKAIYGKDNESADTVLGWLEEGLSMAQRNGKDALLATFESIKLAVLARQGRSDVTLRIQGLAQRILEPSVSDIDRIASHAQLAIAAFYSGERKMAYEQSVAGQKAVATLPGVPEYVLELHYATALILLDHQLPSRDERLLLRRTIRRLKSAAGASPRMTVHYQLVLMRKAMTERKTDKARKLASELIAGLDQHGNLWGAHEAHRTLAQLLKVENILAAKEHERIARKFGRRLGLSSKALGAEFQDEDFVLPDYDRPPSHFEANPELPSGGGFLNEKTTQNSMTAMSVELTSDHSDILSDWGISAERPEESTLREVIGPLQDTLAAQLAHSMFEINCPDPDIVVPVAVGDLQILIINMVLSSRDAVGAQSEISVELELEELSGDIRRDHEAGIIQPGRYMLVRIHARGTGNQVPVIGGFKACDGLIKPMGGELTASAGRGRIILLGRIPLDAEVALPEAVNYGKILIVHPDPAIRDTITAALEEIGVTPMNMTPREFEPGHLEGATLMLTDADTLRKHRVLEPLISTRLVEVVRRGLEPATTEHATVLRVPFALSELEELLKSLTD